MIGDRGGRARGSRGFTVLELAVALGLAGLVALAALSLLGVLYGADSLASRRFDDTAELERAYRTVRNITRSVTAMKLSDTAPAGPEPGQREIAEVEQTLKAQAEERGVKVDEAQVRAQAVELARAQAAVKASQDDERTRIAPRFEVRLEQRGSGGALPVLEAALDQSPVPMPDDADPGELWELRTAPIIRGVVEGVRPEGERGGWMLQWRPIEPVGTPTVIARNLRGWEWQVLPRLRFDKSRSGWQDVASAWYEADYPTAVRLRMVTLNDREVDWLFEFPRPIPEVDLGETRDKEPVGEGDGTKQGEGEVRSESQDGSGAARKERP